MRRVGFTMKLKPGMKDEYAKRHREIWPELVSLLHDAGISGYSIFLDKETNTLFAYQQVAGDSGSQDLGSTDVVQRWWAHMADIMETNADKSPVTKHLEELFYME